MTAWLPEHEVLLTAGQIRDRVREMGAEIARDYRGKLPVLVCVLQGAVVFLADLIREIDTPIRLDFIGVSSYGDATQSSGVVRITKDLDIPVEGRDVVIVEDIVDTGLTLNYLATTLAARKPRSLAVCTLLDKPEPRVIPVQLKYVGFVVPNRFLVGYGLDCAGRYREVPFLFCLDPAQTEVETE